tara:strand:+ start:87 stop:341 length:255 start_codon:yes stop_codon:yes gene_type:complete
MSEEKIVENMDDIVGDLITLGQLRYEDMYEFQYVLKLIHESDHSEENKNNMGLMLNMLLFLANNYLASKKEDKEKTDLQEEIHK